MVKSVKNMKKTPATPEDKLVKELKDVFKDSLLSLCKVEFTAPPPKQGEKKELALPKTEQELIAIVNDLVDEKVKKLMKNYKSKKIRILPLSGLWQSCYDQKHELLLALIKSKVIFDKGLIKSLIAADKLKMMALQRLKKYILSMILVGSVSRGTMHAKSDVDISFVIDDTDVKRMGRHEVLARLRKMILSMAAQTGFEFNIQVYLLTDFWQSLRDTQPVIFSMVRDGIPLYDKGMFTPWRVLLKSGKMRPSPEAVSQFHRTGRLLMRDIKNSIRDLVIERIFLTMFNPAQAAGMMIGIPPSDANTTPKEFRKHFVKETKLIEPKYADYLAEILKIRKDVEYGIKKEVTAKELLTQMEHAESFLNRIDKLFEDIREKQIGKSIAAIETESTDAIIKTLSSMGIKANKSNAVEVMREKLLNSGLITGDVFDFAAKELVQLKQDQKRKMLTTEETHLAEKKSKSFVKNLEALSQVYALRETEKSRIHFKYDGSNGELWILGDKIFIIKDLKHPEREVLKAILEKDGGFSKTQISNLKELNDAREKLIGKEVVTSVKTTTLTSVSHVLGKDVEFTFV